MGIAGILLDIFNLFVYLPFLKVDEEEIGKNIRHLKKQDWFQNYLQHEEFRNIIIHDKDVRQLIGKFSEKKLRRPAYQLKCQRKLRNMIIKKLEEV